MLKFLTTGSFNKNTCKTVDNLVDMFYNVNKYYIWGYYLRKQEYELILSAVVNHICNTKTNADLTRQVVVLENEVCICYNKNGIANNNTKYFLSKMSENDINDFIGGK